MPNLNIKTTHRSIKVYYAGLEKYEANLKRDLPHIPYAKDFWGFAKAGAHLAELHVNYESQPEYDKLKFITVSVETVDIIDNLPALEIK